MLFQQVISPLAFKQWLWREKENKRLLLLSVIGMVISFTWLKIVYPYPNFMPPDSYSYLEAASTNQFINIWPIGYSRFLRLVSGFSSSHMVLVVLQYLLLQASVLHFLFTIRYLLSPGKWLFRVLLVISMLNPLLLHIANFVSGDCLFTALSLVWFTQLLWIIYQPTLKLLFVHAVVLLLAFMVRFTAIYYPFISVAIIVFIDMPKRTKWLGMGFMALLLLTFIGRTQYEYKMQTNTTQYAAFGGWQIAANALYGYAYAQPDDWENLPAKFKDLHQLVNRHMDSLRHLAVRPDKEVAIYYLWDFNSPLVVYMNNQWNKDSNTTYFKQWASMGPLYAEYGRLLIQKHPWPFIKRYIWPNFKRYYGPPAYFMGMYNMGRETVDPVAVAWFDWKNNQLPTRSKDRQIHIISFFPNLVAIINPLFLLSSIIFICLTGFRKNSRISKRIIGCVLVLWLSNALFSVFSAPIELRYQLFPLVITLPFVVFFITRIIQSLQAVPTRKEKQVIPFPEATI